MHRLEHAERRRSASTSSLVSRVESEQLDSKRAKIESLIARVHSQTSENIETDCAIGQILFENTIGDISSYDSIDLASNEENGAELRLHKASIVTALPVIAFDDDWTTNDIISAICWLEHQNIIQLKIEANRNNIVFVDVLLNRKELNLKRRDIHEKFKLVIFHFMPDLTSNFDDSPHLVAPDDVDGLYEIVLSNQETRKIPNDALVPAELIPTLRSYQKQALEWMLEREQKESKSLLPSWREIELKDNSKLYYDTIKKIFSNDQSSPPFEIFPPGGILADEMGLGKTVEILSLILSNPCPRISASAQRPVLPSDEQCDWEDNNHVINCVCGASTREGCPLQNWIQCLCCHQWHHFRCVKWALWKNEFVCPRCWTKAEPIASPTTLVVSPHSIARQWKQEIEKHVEPGKLRYMIYNGVVQDGFISPYQLAGYDVVIVTYETLRSEFRHADVAYGKEGHNIRHSKRYVVKLSPLPAVKWWRICLDEAQMVESTSAKAALMTKRLHAVNRWCVTGTPIQQGPEDIYGLLLFLGVEPYCEKSLWKRLLYDPYVREKNACPLVDVLKRLFWRTLKQDVLDELGVPPQTEEEKWLSFSSLEAFFYQREQESCSLQAERMIRGHADAEASLSSLRTATVKKMLGPLYRLRLACCHPQVVVHRDMPGLLSRSTMTMEQLLETMIARTTRECRDGHRQILFSLNGLAAIHALAGNISLAVDKYREAIGSWKEHGSTVETDLTQKIHTLYNLSELLNANDSTCSRALSDDNIAQELEGLEEEFLSRFNARLSSEETNWDTQKKAVEECEEKIGHDVSWWSDVIQTLELHNMDGQAVTSIRLILNEAQISGRNREGSSLAERFVNSAGLSYVLLTGLDKIQSCRLDVIKSIDELTRSKLTEEEVHVAAACHLRPTQSEHRPRCTVCHVEEIIKAYEATLFSKTQQAVTHRGDVEEDLFPEEEDQEDQENQEDNDETEGRQTWADSEIEKILKTLFSMARNIQSNGDVAEEVIEQGRLHLQLFDTLKKEFKILRRLWVALSERVSGYDELAMSKTRLRFRSPDEPLTQPRDASIIERDEINLNRMRFEAELVSGQELLRTSLGHRSYLDTLSASQSEIEEINRAPCPVCRSELGVEWAVMTCGHSVCSSCCTVMSRPVAVATHHYGRILRCPLCRQLTRSDAVTFVRVNPVANDDAIPEVEGNHSAKVNAVVRCLMEIREDDAEAKTLVFSTWQSVLGILSAALTKNSISHRLINKKGTFQSFLTEFKESEDVNVLLLPLHSGANGLNIIEATHVILVEPALNTANELQAIGRVHRIGQTKPTFVHRFYIQDTVEDRMHALLRRKPSPNAKKQELGGACNLTVTEWAALFKTE